MIKVVCPPKETYCSDHVTSQPTCTIHKVCGLSQDAVTQGMDATAAVPPSKPTIVLQGPARVTIEPPAAYERCPPTVGPNFLCDHGAQASDEKDGNLDAAVQVCGAQFRLAPTQPSNTTLTPAYAACKVNASVPGGACCSGCAVVTIVRQFTTTQPYPRSVDSVPNALCL